MEGNITVIVDENNNILDNGQEGQLCLGGKQLTAGYWRNEEKNREAFFHAEYQGKKERFYKTGDLCRSDNEGDLLYVGRVDFQVKIQGFRVELTEIEFHAKQFFQKTNLVALAIADHTGNSEIAIAFETTEFDTRELVAHLKSKLPAYMLPKKFAFVQPFPLNVNGKTDRNKISKLIA
jgi:acyl-coenzyme A synthetase/AMP-(fatty) acid ligase